jgi:glycosyltransferase involved in cell wall biosynthesis
MIRIGFLDRSDASWTAGASYSRSMVNALASAADARCELTLLSGPRSSLAKLPSAVRPLRMENRASPADVLRLVAEQKLDVLLPITEALLPETDCALIGWIPDFQHRRLPHYFTEEQRNQRDRHFAYLIENCDAMMFSSESVRADFAELYPNFTGRTASIHFPSSFAYESDIAAGDPRHVVEKYKLPEAFVVVANQFWKHKNHRLVVEAVAQARRTQSKVQVVMVGMLSDSRDVSNPHLSELVRRLSTEGLFENIRVLGEVPFPDLVALLRCAVEVVQPSEFEGWNTTLQDAMALGKPVACSDLATHREQAPDAFFFAPDDAASLAAHLTNLDWSRNGWQGGEPESLAAERERGRKWADGLITFCEEVTQDSRTRGRQRTRWKDSVEELKANPLTYIDYLEAQNQRLLQNEPLWAGRIEELRDKNAQLHRKMQDALERERTLKEKLRVSRAETQEALASSYREKTIPLRERLRDELLRRFGRKTPHGNPPTK